MTKKAIKESLINMEEQTVFEISGKEVQKPSYFRLYFFKVDKNCFLACDVLAGFMIGSIIEENYMDIERTTNMIGEYFKDGYIFEDIYSPNFPRKVN